MSGKHVAMIVSSHSSGISGVVADAKRLMQDSGGITHLHLRRFLTEGLE